MNTVLFEVEGAFSFTDSKDYYFLDNEGKKISLNECLIEDIMNIGGIFLTKDMLKVLIPILQTFADTGYFPKNIEATPIRGCCDCKLNLDECGKCQKENRV